MYLDRQVPYEHIKGEIVPDPTPQHAQVSLPWDIKVNRLCPGNVQRVLFDADTGDMVAAYDRTPSSISVKMGDTKLVKTFQLPLSLPARVRYTANVCFSCNPLQHIWPIFVQTPELYFSTKQ
jgi:hypothetical protein